jgi:putative oxidoreductase
LVFAGAIMEDFGKLVLRLGVGGMMLFHGGHKLLTGLDAVKALLVSHKLPDALAYVVYFGEIAGPLLVIIGLFARFGAFLIAFEVAALVALGGLAQIIALTPDGGYALEIEALYLTGALAIVLLGPGKLAVAQGKHQ